MTYTVIMCGDRNWTHREVITDFFRYILPSHTVIVQGGCRGADTICKEEAEKNGNAVITVDAKWDKYGVNAGPIRNKEMMKHKPDWVIAFHEHIELSKGTKHMLILAEKSGTPWILCGRGGVIKTSDSKEILATSDIAAKQRKISDLLFKEKNKPYIS